MAAPIILDDIPFQVSMGQLLKRLRVEPGSSDARELQTIVGEAQNVASPKALYKVAFISSKDDDGVVIDGTRLSSRVLRVNLEQAHRVFLSVATCGAELDAWSRSIDDLLQHYWAEEIKAAALGSAIKALNDHLVDHYRLGKTSTMSPGRLSDWPLKQQRPLFALLGNTERHIGVRLNKSCLMIPNKSVSGIRFPTEVSFESCQLCPRADCPGRHAPYDRDLYERKYRKAVSW